MLAVLARAQEVGFVGSAPLAGHVDHALGFAGDQDPPPGLAFDLGSGAGLPGLVLALAWPDSQWVLVEAMERRAAFLSDALTALGLESRVRVFADRAERAGRVPEWRGTGDLVVARSFGSPAVTAEVAAPLLRIGGSLVVSEPPADDPARWPPGPLEMLGLEDAGLVAGRRYRRLVCRTAVSERFPRRVGVPAKRPLW